MKNIKDFLSINETKTSKGTSRILVNTDSVKTKGDKKY